MKIKTLLIVSLLFGLWAGSANAQSRETWTLTQDFNDNDMHGWRFYPEEWPPEWIVPDYGKPMSVLVDDDVYVYLNHGEPEGYSFYFGTDTRPDQDSYLISPELAGTENGIHLSFYYSNIFQGATTFQVGYSTFTDDPEEFVWGEVITAYESNYWENGGVATWMKKEMDFPRNVKYIAFSMTRNQSGSTLCIDDIVIASANCALPALFQVTGTTSNSIALSWQDYGESYTYDVQYANTLFYNFDEGELDPWTSFGNGGGVNTWYCDDEMEGHNGTRCAYSTLTIDDAEEVYFDYDNYLVSPLMDLSGSVSFYAKAGSLWGKAEFAGTQFEVMVYPGSSISEADSANFVKIGEGTVSDDWGDPYEFTISGYDGQQGYLIIRHINDIDDETWDISYLLIDDVTISGGVWTTQNTTNANYTIEGLSPETTCFVKIRGNVGENHSSWTDLLQVKTFPTAAPSSYAFITAGDWNVPSNWQNWYMPQNVTDPVIVNAAAVIPEGCVAKGTITMVNNDTITIKDGGQLVHNNASGNITVTAKKRVWAYPDEGKSGYYLLASPVGATPSQVTNMLTDDYDLYFFDQTEGYEWQNYKTQTTFVLSPYQGYLYANSNNVTLSFTGAIKSSEEGASSSLEYDSDAGFAGWNLVGNPFMCNAYIGRPFYRLTHDSDELEAVVSGVIAPLEGVFVQAENENDNVITFSREPAQSNNGNGEGMLNVNVIRNEANVDVARVRFGEGQGLEKFQLNPSHTKVYFPQNGKNYAVVNAGSIDELPFCFKAENDDTYTLSFTQEQVEFSYLHLIDNLTGADIDLLQQSEYTFEAKVTDYASRFRVVFVAKDEDGSSIGSETFAFNSNGDFIIVNEGQATLQVIDLQGRMLSSETIEGCTSKTLQAAPGVYVLRLINGENVRVQKVVVR